MFRYASVTAFAVFRAQWHPDHASNTKILVIIFPEAQKLVDDFLLFCEATELRNITRFIEHCAEVEVAAKSQINPEYEVCPRKI